MARREPTEASGRPRPAGGAARRQSTHAASDAPRTIGRYRLGELLGEGRFGVVFEAEQTEPVARAVALKIIHRGVAPRAVIAGLNSIRPLHDAIDHPHLGKVLDAGIVDEESAWIVTELVEGLPVTDFCDEHRLGRRQRLELFIDVCDAVLCAHQKGVIHGGLKPSNILVITHGRHPSPKVIDFGLAGAVALHPADMDADASAGTLSPEQAANGSADVDTRTDVYQLGRVLRDLLDAERNAPPRGDLEWIVGAAVAEERERRYTTVAALADDVRRHLRHEPISVAPPDRLYRLRKLVRRDGLLVGTITASVALLLLLLLITFVAMARGNADRAAQRQAVDEAAVALRSAEARRDESDRYAALLDGVLKANGPGERDATWDTLLDRTEALIEDAGGPLVEARLRHTVGAAYLSLGAADQAERHFAECLRLRVETLGTDEELTRESRRVLALLYATLDRDADAAALWTEMLESDRRVFGARDRQTLDTMLRLAVVERDLGHTPRVVPLLGEALEVAETVLEEDDPGYVLILGQIGRLYADVNRPASAEPLMTRVVELRRVSHGPADETTLESMNELARIRVARGGVDEAEQLFQEMIEIAENEHGDGIITLRCMNNLARLYRDHGRPADAAGVYAKAVGRLRRSGHAPLYLGITLSGYGRCLVRLERYEDAEAALLESHRIVTESGDHTRRRNVAAALAELYDEWDRPDEAKRWRADP